MNGETAAATVTAAAAAIAQNRTVEEIELLGVLFTQLGDTLVTIAAFRSSSERNTNNQTDKK